MAQYSEYDDTEDKPAPPVPLIEPNLTLDNPQYEEQEAELLEATEDTDKAFQSPNGSHNEATRNSLVILKNRQPLPSSHDSSKPKAPVLRPRRDTGSAMDNNIPFADLGVTAILAEPSTTNDRVEYSHASGAIVPPNSARVLQQAPEHLSDYAGQNDSSTSGSDITNQVDDISSTVAERGDPVPSAELATASLDGFNPEDIDSYFVHTPETPEANSDVASLHRLLAASDRQKSTVKPPKPSPNLTNPKAHAYPPQPSPDSRSIYQIIFLRVLLISAALFHAWVEPGNTSLRIYGSYALTYAFAGVLADMHRERRDRAVTVWTLVCAYVIYQLALAWTFLH